ncbi:MAG: hypothetical protein ACI89Z_001336 [Porticoccus sp.]|jgi:hypothetical protein
MITESTEMTPESTERCWRQYATHIDLYKFYLGMVVKINAFHFAISGAIFSFYFTNANVDNPDIRWSFIETRDLKRLGITYLKYQPDGLLRR